MTKEESLWEFEYRLTTHRHAPSLHGRLEYGNTGNTVSVTARTQRETLQEPLKLL